MSHHETSFRNRKPKVVPIRRNYRSRPSASRRNYLDQDLVPLLPPSRAPPRSKSVCLRFRYGLQKLLPREPQTIRNIRICFKCLPLSCVDNNRRIKSVKFRRPKSKRQLQLLRKAGTGKLLAYREAYLRLPPGLETNEEEEPVDDLQSSGDYDATTDEKDFRWSPLCKLTKSSVSTISCADLEPPSEVQYGRRCSTPYFPPPTPFQDRNIVTPQSLPRTATPLSQRPRSALRSLLDLRFRNKGSHTNFDFNKISRPHMTKKPRFPPSEVRRPNETAIVPSIVVNLPRVRGLTAIKLPGTEAPESQKSEQIQSSSGSYPKCNVAKPTMSSENTKLRNTPPEGNRDRDSKPKSVHFEFTTDEETDAAPSVSSFSAEADVKPKSVSSELTQSGLALKKSMSDLMKVQLSKLHEPKCDDDDIENSNEIVSSSRSSTPTLEAESFPEYEKTVDSKKIEMKHIKAELSRSRILEETSQECRSKQKQWDQQRLISLCQSRLDEEQTTESINITGRIESRFHLIHSFNRCMNDKIKQVGRYFDMEANRLVAIKIYGNVSPLSSTEKLQSKLAALAEISALSKMTNCYNVVQMITYFELDGRFHLVLESCDHSLRDEIEMAETGIPPEKAQRIIQHILNAVAYCHFQKCLHRDISPDNLLVTSDGVVKLADFDLAVFVDTDQAKLDISPGSIPYAAPELLMKRSNYGLSADIWSVGCVVAELLKGSPLWNYSSAEEQLLHIQNSFTPSLPEYPDMAKCSEVIQRGPNKTLQKMLPAVSEDAMSLISKCLNIEPHKRSTCSELLQHPFLMPNSSGDHAEATIESDWKAWTEGGSLPQTPVTFRPQSALTLAEYESSVDDYDHERYIMSCLSDVAGTTATERGASASSGSPVARIKSKTKVPQGQDEVTSPGFDTNSKQMKKRGKKKEEKNSSDKPSDMETEFGGYKTGDCESRSSRASLPILAHGVNRQDSNESTILPRIVNRQVSCESAMIRRKMVSFNPLRSRVHIPRKLDAIRMKKASLTNLTLPKLSASQMCEIARNSVNSPRPKFPNSSKEILKYIIESLPVITGDSCDEICSHLNRISKTAPKMFNNHLNLLVSAILQQISIPKTRQVIPAMKILETLFQISPKGLNESAEKIIDVVLSKVGGPLFIDNSCCRIFSKLVNNVDPHRLCWHLARIGPTQRTGMARSVACKFLCDSMRCLSLNEDIGDTTPSKRRFTNLIFDSALKFSRDSHSPTREYAKELLCILVNHLEFWRLYMDIVPDVERSRVNRILDDIRRTRGTGPTSKSRLL